MSLDILLTAQTSEHAALTSVVRQIRFLQDRMQALFPRSYLHWQGMYFRPEAMHHRFCLYIPNGKIFGDELDEHVTQRLASPSSPALDRLHVCLLSSSHLQLAEMLLCFQDEPAVQDSAFSMNFNQDPTEVSRSVAELMADILHRKIDAWSEDDDFDLLDQLQEWLRVCEDIIVLVSEPKTFFFQKKKVFICAN